MAGWARARDTLAASTLHRALRSDVTFRFVEIASVGSVLPGFAPRFTAHPALYELVREAGDPGGAGGTVLITPFEVPAGEDERFLASWDHIHELFATRQGHLGARLHRSLGPADFRFVAVVRWSSPLMYARTLQQPEAASAVAAMPFAGRPALYLPLAAAGGGT